MAIKMLTTERLDDVEYGIYSHRLGDMWLVGGASNTGGAVLRQFFTDEQMRKLTPLLKPSEPTGLDYYPLPIQGERFPTNDPKLQPHMDPRPDNDAVFFQGLLEGIARIEAKGYALLGSMGSCPVNRVVTAGGGAANEKWNQIRQAALGVPVERAMQGNTGN
eukprot:evm.model.scf_173.4 EVM.evm.TU.scf_173.4   scf_173:34342-35932(-)